MKYSWLVCRARAVTLAGVCGSTRQLFHALLLAIPALGLALAPLALAADQGYLGGGEVERYWVEEEPRTEQAAAIPPVPEDDDLRPFAVSGLGARRDYAVDSRHLAVGADDITRYTVVIRSGGGARNVLHEAVDCVERRYKTYAYGRHDGTFRELPTPQWKTLVTAGPEAFRFQLARNFLCDAFWRPRPVAEVLERLRYPTRPESDVSDGYAF